MKANIWTYYLLILLVIGVCGCGGNIAPDYGASDSSFAENSPGGLSVLREMVKARRLDTETLAALRPSLDQQVSTIVWAPGKFPHHSKPVLDRLDAWLRQGGKTLVYIGRDYSPHADYWDRIASNPANSISATQRSRVMVQASKASHALDEVRDEQRQLLITPWFYWRMVPGPFHKVSRFQGDWSSDSNLANCEIYIRSTLNPFDSNQLDALQKELDWNPPAAVAVGGVPVGGGPVGGAPPAGFVPPATTPPPARKGFRFIPRVFKGQAAYTKIWNTDDEELLAIAKSAVASDRDSARVLLANSDGSPIITEVVYKNGTSRVLILSNSSMVSNLGLLHNSNRELVDRIIDKFPSGNVGFMSMDDDPPLRKGLAHEEHKGFEMLTVWPFSFMTIHAALIAMIAMIAAFPIFGRPKILPKRSQADFSEHVESLGELLRATGGRKYAKDAIAKYFRVVRRDTTTFWARQDSIDPNHPIVPGDGDRQ
jgi:hypothetical protein